MSLLRDYVAKLPNETRHQIINSYEQFERDGYIGASPVRQHARAFIESISSYAQMSITEWMKLLTYECYRYYYYQGESN